MLEQPSGARSTFQQHDYQLKYVGAIGPAGNRIAPPAFVGFFVDGEIEGHELTGLKFEFLQFVHPDPEATRIGRFVLHSNDRSGPPGLWRHGTCFVERYDETK